MHLGATWGQAQTGAPRILMSGMRFLPVSRTAFLSRPVTLCSRVLPVVGLWTVWSRAGQLHLWMCSTQMSVFSWGTLLLLFVQTLFPENLCTFMDHFQEGRR